MTTTTDSAVREKVIDVQLTLRPDVAARAIRYMLTRYRLLAGNMQTDAAERLGVRQSTIAGIEGGRHLPSVAQLELLLDFYGRKAQFNKMRTLRDVAVRRNRADNVSIGLHSDVELLLGLEYAAATIEQYELTIVTGLLQTEDYARAITEVAAEFKPALNLDEALKVRMERQAMLYPNGDGREAPLHLIMYIEQAALERPIGGPAVLARQLDDLLKAMKRGNIDIRVIPRSVVYHPALRNAFKVLTFDDDFKVVHVETSETTHYYDTAAALENHGRLISDLRSRACNARESARLISEIGEGLESS